MSPARRLRRDVEDLLRESAPRVLAAVVRRFGDFADSEDAVQEAMIDAARQWPAEGVPESPVGWLIAVASRRMTDRIRADSARRDREDRLAAEPSPGPSAEADDTLALIFMCCRPELSSASAIALTLRAVGGLTTAEIAAAFLVPETTMGRRIARAKKTVAEADEPFGLPAPAERTERLRAALGVLYLIFNEGYAASEGAELARVELSGEAIRLARIARLALPEPEVGGLLALMLLTDARRPARTDAHGELVPLAEQDRALWDAGAIAEGGRILATEMAKGAVGPYQLQAAIALAHDRAPRAEDTDWAEILALYGLLERVSPGPMVALNRAVAAAMAAGPEAGLELLAEVEPRLEGHHRVHAVRAHLLELAGDGSAAHAEYSRAAALTASLPEQRYLTRRAASPFGRSPLTSGAPLLKISPSLSSLYFSDPSSLEHDPRDLMPGHPESPPRLVAIERRLAAEDWLGWERRLAPAAGAEELELVHTPRHVAAIRELSEGGGGAIDVETYDGPQSYRAAAHAAGGAAALARALLAGEAPTGFSALRPPGHHAEPERAMGFCLFDSIAVAAALAVAELGAARVLILDWDVHHGNGTEAIFGERDDVLLISIQQEGIWPGTGLPEDIGTERGAGFTINLPVPEGSGLDVFLSLIDRVVAPVATEYAPDLILISAGYDAHREDPLAGLALESADFGQMTVEVRELARRLGVPVGAVLEGGYAPAALAESVEATMRALGGAGESVSAPETAVGEEAAARVSAYWPRIRR